MKTGPKPTPVFDRWLRMVEKTDTCWLWTGGKQPNGYGRLCGSRGKVLLAHRWTYEHFVGPIPDGMTIDHICRVKACVNPDHLRVMTRSENSRLGNLARFDGRCLRGHSLDDPTNVYIVTGGARQCRECARIRGLIRLARRRERRAVA